MGKWEKSRFSTRAKTEKRSKITKKRDVCFSRFSKKNFFFEITYRITESSSHMSQLEILTIQRDGFIQIGFELESVVQLLLDRTLLGEPSTRRAQHFGTFEVRRIRHVALTSQAVGCKKNMFSSKNRLFQWIFSFFFRKKKQKNYFPIFSSVFQDFRISDIFQKVLNIFRSLDSKFISNQSLSPTILEHLDSLVLHRLIVAQRVQILGMTSEKSTTMLRGNFLNVELLQFFQRRRYRLGRVISGGFVDFAKIALGKLVIRLSIKAIRSLLDNTDKKIKISGFVSYLTTLTLAHRLQLFLFFEFLLKLPELSNPSSKSLHVDVPKGHVL